MWHECYERTVLGLLGRERKIYWVIDEGNQFDWTSKLTVAIIKNSAQNCDCDEKYQVAHFIRNTTILLKDNRLRIYKRMDLGDNIKQQENTIQRAEVLNSKGKTLCK